MIEISVDLGERSYPVLVGAGARHRLLDVIPTGATKVMIVTQDSVPVECDPGMPFEKAIVGNGEAAKTMKSVEDLCRQFARFGMNRRDCVVAVGGGMVTDLAGFAASVYHRGMAVVHVATTLLAQVDAAIGGKTAVNVPEGRNLVGSFWQPAAVLCDTETLETLSPAEYRNGTGEVAKYHFIGKPFGIETSNLQDLPLDERIARCVELKAKVVSGDEREGSSRAILNYGHTLAHAVERATDFDVRHGEAVAIGVHFAALLANNLGRIDSRRVEQHRKVLEFYGLPMRLPEHLDPSRLLSLMRSDKKAFDSLTFVLDGPDGPEVVENVPADIVVATLGEIR